MSGMRIAEKNLPSLSIVVTCYNLEKYIAETLKSVFNQDYQGRRELIVVDDASTDNSMSVIRQVVSECGTGWDVTILRNEINMGVAGATDCGWHRAKYDWIVEVDGDDIQYENRCSALAELIKQYPEAEMIVMSQTCINSEGEVFMIRNMVMAEGVEDFCAVTPSERADIYLNRRTGMPVNRGAYGCSMSIRRSLVERWGRLYKEGTERFAQDPPWELRAFLSAPVLWSNRLACKYRTHESNILNRERKRETLEDWVTNELDMCRYAGREKKATEKMLKDLHRADSDVGLTDWSKEDLMQCSKMLSRYELVQELRANWWSHNSFVRLFLAFQYSGKVPSEFSRWFMNRILPLRLSIRLRMMKQRIKK